MRVGHLVKARHQNWDRVPSNFNQAEWMLDHTTLVNKRVANWKVGGYNVDIKGQNRFVLRGRLATLVGMPDLIARRHDAAVIIDAKTGRESPSHVIQAMIYQYAIPRALEQYRNVEISGQVTYPDHTVRIPAKAVDDKFVQNLVALILRVSLGRQARHQGTYWL